MKRQYSLFFLAGYVLLMGVIGMLRSGAWAPVLVTGVLALVTAGLGLLIGTGKRGAHTAAAIWTGINVMLYLYLAIGGEMVAHGENRPGSEYIYGSMALVAALVFFGLLGDLRRKHTPRNL